MFVLCRTKCDPAVFLKIVICICFLHRPSIFTLTKQHKYFDSWTMRARTCKMMQMPGQTTDAIPGPGTYPVPATTTFDHPTMKMPGGTKFGSAPRFKDYDPEDA